MYKGLSFRYQVFGTTPNFLPISGSDRKVFLNVRKDSEPLVFLKIGCSLELNEIMIGNREKIKLLFFLLHTINFKVYLEKVIKFVFSKKATKFNEIFTYYLTLTK